MLKPRTLKLLAIILVTYDLLLLPASVWPDYLDSPFGALLLAPPLVVYMFHGAGVPGLLENNGFCGWGWCAPTIAGWLLVVVFWVASTWLIAWGITSLTSRLTAR